MNKPVKHCPMDPRVCECGHWYCVTCNRPRISLIFNTASKDPAVQGGNPFRATPYSVRYALFKDKILLPSLEMGFDEVIVCGVFEAGEGYTYVPMKPMRRDRRDALHQRDLGGAYATGDLLVFCHDDHLPGPGFVEELKQLNVDTSWDLLVPKRLHGITGAELNNGRADNYMGGHCLVMCRQLWAEVPWTSVDTEWWDTSLTRLWREAGARIVWTDALTHLDMEATEDET